MSYITSADLAKRLTSDELVQLADLDEDGAADSAVLAQAIADAESLVNSYIAARTTVPLTTVPDMIKAVSISMAIYFLHLGRRSVTDDIGKQYDRDLAFLKDVAAGKVTLGEVVSTVGEPHPTPEYHRTRRRFSRKKLKGW